MQKIDCQNSEKIIKKVNNMYSYERFYDHFAVTKDGEILYHIDNEKQAKEEVDNRLSFVHQVTNDNTDDI